MKMLLAPLLILALAACASQDAATTALAVRLATENGEPPSAAVRKAVIDCGVEALGDIPTAKIEAALKAPDVPAIWDILGSDALDTYVATCRKADPRP